MFGKFIKFVLILSLILGGTLPTLAYYNGNFTFRSTVTGTSYQNLGGSVYKINGQKTNFSTNESVVALTRIFNITNIDSFRFKLELIQNGRIYKTEYSQFYYPRNNWWAETYSIADFGRLSEGSYELRTYISVDNNAYSHLNSINLSVSNYYNYNNNYNYTYDNYYNNNYNYGYNFDNYSNYNYGYQPYYQPAPKYSYSWTHTGTSLRNLGNGQYEVNDSKTSFSTSENIEILTKISNIENINTFRIKQEVYLNSNTLYRTNISPERRLNGAFLNYDFHTANYGRLPAGSHQVRVYISINNQSYALLEIKNFTVYNAYNYNYNYNYQQNYHNNPYYSFGNMQFGNHIDHLYGYTYRIQAPKTSFTTADDVKVLTRLTNISGISYFRVKHVLYRGAYDIKTMESPIQRPNNSYWEYNYTQNNFGRLSAGDYTVKAYVSVNGGAYTFLDQKNIKVISYTVPTNYNYNHNYNNYSGYSNNYNQNYNGFTVPYSGSRPYSNYRSGVIISPLNNNSAYFYPGDNSYYGLPTYYY